MKNREMRRGGGGDGGIICLISTQGGEERVWVLTGSHKQVAASLPRGPAVMMRRGGAAAAVWRGERQDALQQHLSLGR